MQLFAQIRKVDEDKRLVYGRIAEEAVDKSDEIMDYATSKPHFVKWSEDIARDTDGKSLGNVRAMHGKVAAGKLTAIDFGDAAKTVDVCAKVVDDGEWKKVLEGVYTGFSIGGSYVGDKKVEKVDGRDVTRYTARPTEVSLVDRPCMHGARFFEVQKADGTLAKVEFQAQAAEAEDVTVNGTAEQVAALGKMMNAHGLTLAEVVEKALPAFIEDKKKAKAKLGEKADPDAADEGKEKPAADDEAAKAAKAADLAKAADAANAAADDALAKLETALSDALAKAGARNSTADAARIAKIHDMAVELGHECKPAAEKAATGDLAKADTGALEKMVADAIAPLQKALGEAQAQITKLEAQPAPARISLRAIAKTEDVIADLAPVEKAATPIRDDHGDEHVAAGLIKSIHRGGGAPMAMPLRK